MQNRYSMTTKDGVLFIEAPYTDEGKKELEGIRKALPKLLKGQHIREIIQAMPSKIKVYQFYRYGQIV